MSVQAPKGPSVETVISTGHGVAPNSKRKNKPAAAKSPVRENAPLSPRREAEKKEIAKKEVEIAQQDEKIVEVAKETIANVADEKVTSLCSPLVSMSGSYLPYNLEIINSNVYYMDPLDKEQDVLDEEMLTTVAGAKGQAERIAKLYENLPRKTLQDKKEAYAKELELIEAQRVAAAAVEKKMHARTQHLERAVKSFNWANAFLNSMWGRIDYQLSQLKTNLDYIKGLAKYTDSDIEKVSPLKVELSLELDQVLNLMETMDELKDTVMVVYNGLNTVIGEDYRIKGKENDYKEIESENLNGQTARIYYKHYTAKFNQLDEAIPTVKKSTDSRIKGLKESIAKLSEQLKSTSEKDKINELLDNIKAANREITMIENAWYWIGERKKEANKFLGYIKGICPQESDLAPELMDDCELIQIPSEEVNHSRDVLQDLVKLKELTVRTYENMYRNQAAYGITDFYVGRYKREADLKLARETYVFLNNRAKEVQDRLTKVEEEKRALLDVLNDKLESPKKEFVTGKITHHIHQINTMKTNWASIQRGIAEASQKLEDCKRVIKKAERAVQPETTSYSSWNLLGWLAGGSNQTLAPAKTASSENLSSSSSPSKEEAVQKTA